MRTEVCGSAHILKITLSFFNENESATMARHRDAYLQCVQARVYIFLGFFLYVRAIVVVAHNEQFDFTIARFKLKNYIYGCVYNLKKK